MAESETTVPFSELQVTDGVVFEICDQAARNALDGKQDALDIDGELTAQSSGVPTSAAVRAWVAENGGGKTLGNTAFLELING